MLTQNEQNTKWNINLLLTNQKKTKYMKLLYVTKREYLKTQFQDHKGNSTHLYKFMAKLTGGVSVNPMPDSNLDVELANDFTKFFWNKIV